MNTRTNNIILLTGMFCLLLITAQAQSAEVLTNQDVISLSQLEMGDAIILNKISNSMGNYDVSTNGLIGLKKAGVSDAVIAKLVEAASDDTKHAEDPNDVRSLHRPGIYYYNGGDLTELLPNVCSQSKTSGALGSRLSYGIAKMKVKARVAGGSARKQFSSAPEFYFYFRDQQRVVDDNETGYYGFVTGTSPNEFALVKMETKTDVREIEVGSANAYTSESGIDEKNQIPFQMEQMGAGVFRVTLNSGMEAGEYCFVFSGSAPSQGSQQKVFDFGLQ